MTPLSLAELRLATLYGKPTAAASRPKPVREFQQAVWAWQMDRHGAQDGSVVVLDGKALRGSQGTQLVGVINAQSGRTLGVEAVADKSNEIPAAQTLLGRLQLDGVIALMDAL